MSEGNIQRLAFYYVKDGWCLAGRIRSFFSIAELGLRTWELEANKAKQTQPN